MQPILSIIICTYNRSEWLRSCLSSLEPQCKHGVVEILIVDNNSSDGTAKVAREYTERLSNFSYVFEKTQGLSHARNRGIVEAQGEFIAYLDDDARAHSDWVLAVLDFFRAHPNVNGVGGPYDPFSTTPIPDWFPKEFGRWSLGPETRKLRDGEWINGGNMAFRKNALIEVNGFDTSLGMTGSKVSYGEETNLLLKMLANGMQIYYCAEMRIDHAILPHKLKLRWLLKSHFSNGYDYVRTTNYQGSLMRHFPTLFAQLKATILNLVFSKERYFKTRVYRALAPLFWQVGFIKRLSGF